MQQGDPLSSWEGRHQQADTGNWGSMMAFPSVAQVLQTELLKNCMKSIVMENMIPITTTAHLVVPKRISNHVADWALGSLLKHLDPQPVPKAQSEFTVQQVKAQCHGRDHIQSISSM